jgi:peptidoglycan hydrolase-like protein with peptidoglycan-binding domain
MKRALLCFFVASYAVSFTAADETIRSLQQTLKNQGFYYGSVTGDKSAETTAAIRRYQIRNGLQVTGELNEETLRAVKSTSNSVAAASRPSPKPGIAQPNNVRPDTGARLSQSSPPSSFSPPDYLLQTNPSYTASFYHAAPIRVNRQIIAGAQYQLMSYGLYRGRVDGRYGRQMGFALRAFQSSAGLPSTGRLDTETLKALGSSDADFAYEAPASRGYETWMPVRKFKHGEWKVKWKRNQRPFNGADGDEDRQANSEPGWNLYNGD